MDLKQHHAAIRDAIEAAKADGFDVEIMRGFTDLASLEIGPSGSGWNESFLTIMEEDRG